MNKKCKGCKGEIPELEEFPGQLCLGCYEKKMDGQTPEELYEAVMTGFGKGGVFK
jgi:hypothetical protein